MVSFMMDELLTGWMGVPLRFKARQDWEEGKIGNLKLIREDKVRKRPQLLSCMQSYLLYLGCFKGWTLFGKEVPFVVDFSLPRRSKLPSWLAKLGQDFLLATLLNTKDRGPTNIVGLTPYYATGLHQV